MRSPEHLAWCTEVRAIPFKKTAKNVVDYLDRSEMDALLKVPDKKTKLGARNYALLLFLYNTGARVSEALALSLRELRLERPPQARLHGKGKKDRLCPLWPETAAALKKIVRTDEKDDTIFRNSQGKPLTRDGVAYLLSKYVHRAAKAMPQLLTRRVTPHVMRHSCAVALLQAGVDVTVIRSWLGHAHLDTTNRYAQATLETKRAALEQLAPNTRSAPPPSWKQDDALLAWLESL